MKMNLKFICNNKLVETEVQPGKSLLDFIRKELRLTGSKEGCREGDCGACTVLVGDLQNDRMIYKTVNSCIMPVGDINGKHLVTIEGLSDGKLNQIQNDFVEQGASQCGFCTPGFIVSLCGYFLENDKPNIDDAINSLDGNVCRCTGYESIRNSIKNSIKQIELSNEKNNSLLKSLIKRNFIPEYFEGIPLRIKELNIKADGSNGENILQQIIGGGTDLLVQRWEEIENADVNLIFNSKPQNKVTLDNNVCKIKATATVSEFCESGIIQKHFPGVTEQLYLFGSLPIRNRATLGGNIINASPIADMTSMLLALNADLVIVINGKQIKVIKLKDFYTGYKTMKLQKGEILDEIRVDLPKKGALFNFEKISRRTYLDIASVNSSIYLEVNEKLISNVHISAGGVAPIPLYLEKTIEYLNGKEITFDVIKQAAEIALKEIKPISDARGSADYKSLLLRNLLFAHFEKFFLNIIAVEELI
jgi:xanthine dehydrogenase small subunit